MKHTYNLCLGMLLGIGGMTGFAWGAEDFATSADGLDQSTAEFKKLFPNVGTKLVVNEKEGIGYDDPTHSVQDPSNVIKVEDTYYVWMSWRPLNLQVFDGDITYATSKDGRHWENKGICFSRGKAGAWDDRGVYTPYVAASGGKYYMFYTGMAKPDHAKGDRIGLAVADSPDGPWKRVSNAPVLEPTPQAWDSHIVDDAHLIVRNGKFWLYYKGLSLTDKWFQSRQGVAMADQIEGPYVKYEKNPVISKGHCACVWPHADGVAAISDLGKEILWSPDGLDFTMVNKGLWWGAAGPGPYDPEAHANTSYGNGIQWGVIQYPQPSAEDRNRMVIARWALNLSAPPKK